ncbi:unnamed protein product [Diamesa hyperborea]
MKVLLIVLTLCSISWCDNSPLVEKLLSKIGQYEFRDENNQAVVKSYYLSTDLTLTWIDSFVMCKTLGMDLVELPTSAEADYFLNICNQPQILLTNTHFHIGGSYLGAKTNEFYWMTTEKRISYPLKWGP